jgi:hypothetical protein
MFVAEQSGYSLFYIVLLVILGVSKRFFISRTDQLHIFVPGVARLGALTARRAHF